MNVKRIVVTGAPGTGKTSVITALEKFGFYCFHEIIRTMTLAAKKEQAPNAKLYNPIVFVDDSQGFNKKLIHGRLEQFHLANDLDKTVVFYDRGTPDVLAYMDYFGQSYDKGFQGICEEHRYDQVFILPPWKEIYVQDNERLESFEQAVDLHAHLTATYTSLGYDIIEVPYGRVTERIRFILKKAQV